MESTKEERGTVLIRSILFCPIGLLFIALGMSFLPVIGIIVGAGFLWFGLSPWLRFLRRNTVKVLVGSVSDNYLEDRRIPVAILSASEQRDGYYFDPGVVDPLSVRIGSGNARPVGDMTDPEVYGRSLRDINDDGIPDLILYFSADSAGMNEKVEEICVRAKTRDGERVFGCSQIETGYESALMKKLEYV